MPPCPLLAGQALPANNESEDIIAPTSEARESRQKRSGSKMGEEEEEARISSMARHERLVGLG